MNKLAHRASIPLAGARLASTSIVASAAAVKDPAMGLLEGKVALVTGGTSGIGRASAVLFAQEGAKVVLTGRRAAEGKAVAAEIEAAGGDALFIQADLTEIGGIPAIIDKAAARYGRLDCAFNNAGVSGGGPVETLDERQWDTV